MSSVQVLFASLQDPQLPLSCGERCRATLLDVLALCQHEDSRRELLSYNSLGILSAFIASTESLIATLDIADVLLEILTALVCDRQHNARHRLASQPSLLAFPLTCIRIFTHKRQGKKRNRILRVSMELLWHLSFTEPSREAHHYESVITLLTRILENPEEDPALLVYATDLLTNGLDGHERNVRMAAKFNTVPTLLRLLNTAGEKVDLKRAVCDALTTIASVGEFVSIIVANNAIHSLSVCLRLKNVNRPAEMAALRLLERLCDESQVYGHVINEDFIPVLFRLLERSSTIDTVRASCSILERVAKFARGCKLDLAPFILTGLPCRGSTLIDAVTTHSQDLALVLSAFRFFAHITSNPTELATLTNADVLEGLLVLYIVHCGGAGNNPTPLASELVTIISQIPRSRIDSLYLAQENQSLPALFLLLKRHARDVRFATKVFAIVAKHLNSRPESAKKAATVSGFIGLAVEMIQERAQQSEGASPAELMEAYNFLREVMLTADGGEVVLASGGVSLYRSLAGGRQGSTKQVGSFRPKVSSEMDGNGSTSADQDSLVVHADRMASIVVEMLTNAISNAVNPSTSKAASEDSGVIVYTGSHNYNLFVQGVIRQEQDRLHSSGDVAAHASDHNQVPSTTPDPIDPEETQGVDQDMCGFQEDNEDQASDGGMSVVDGDQGEEEDDDDDGPNDDGSDSDGQDEVLPTDDVPGSPTTTASESPRDRLRANDSVTEVRAGTAPMHLSVTTNGLAIVDFSHLDDHGFYFLDSDGSRYPKHPYRHSGDPVTLKKDPFLLLHDIPPHNEACRPMDSAAMSAMIEEGNARRRAFLGAEPHARARIVYENPAPYTGQATARPTVELASAPAFMPYEVPKISKAFSSTPSLTFDSWFESGNLERAIQIGEFEYDVILRRDFNTNGHTQWFYFAVSNVQDTKDASCPKYRFNIVNLCKPDSLFNQGLRPVVYSVRDAQERRTGWRRAGDDIFYCPNPFLRPGKATSVVDSRSNATAEPAAEQTPVQPPAATCYTLSFTLEFHNAEDTYLIAHSYPYTFSDHQRHLNHVLHYHRASKRRTPHVVKHSVLCTTISGRPCDLLTITDFTASSHELRSRRAVILTARVHPGEPQASWIMRGAIDFLVSGSETARVLRRLFVFLLVPMLNPDGVFLGNSRCSLSACDLNRQWHDPSPMHHPTIHFAKELIRSEHASRGIVLFCDIHGHSRKKNVFMYGCDTKKRPNPLARVFAKQLAMQPSARRFVSFPDCSFKMSKDKETTARVVLTKELWLPWCFTLEASFCGASFGELQGSHFNTSHLQQVGTALCEALFPTCITDRSLRDKVIDLVDDGSVSVALFVDSHLRESGVVSDANSVRLELTAKQVSASPIPRRDRDKSGGGGGATSTKKEVTQTRRLRRRSEPKHEKKSVNTTSTSATSVAKSSRWVSDKRQGTISTSIASALTRRKASSLNEVCKDTLHVPTKTESRRRQSAKELVKVESTSSRSYQSMNTTAAATHPLLHLLKTLEPPDEEDTQLYKLQSLVRASSGSTSSTSSKPPTPETPPNAEIATIAMIAPTPPPCSPVLPRRRQTLPTTLPSGLLRDASTVFKFSAHEAVPVILPPPVGELLPSKSPKPPSSSLRFKGGGRQYAAVSPAARVATTVEIVKSGSLATAVGYEADLLNASSISLQQRAASALAGAETSATSNPRRALCLKRD